MPREYRAIGEIDLATAPAFNVSLHSTIDRCEEALVSVDCSGVTFMDSAGYHALAEATGYAARRGHTLVIRNASVSCARLIALCDWDHELRVESMPSRFVQGATIR
jgi:anti-anti-sigma factor